MIDLTDDKTKVDWPIEVCGHKIKDAQELYDYIQSLKDYDFVEYFGGERWKDDRSFKDFKLTHKDLHITKKHLDDLMYVLEHQVWPFCDTIFLQDRAEDDEHVLDWCFHGERMGWKAGDEYWLVFNWARQRLELRKANPKKWTPLDKYIINDDLELRFKLGYIYKGDKVKYLQDIGINSFPDRIEIHFNGTTKADSKFHSIMQIFDYYIEKSDYNADLEHALKPFFDLDHIEVQSALDKLPFYFAKRTYNLYNKDEKEDMQKVYDDVLRYSHQLKFYQD